MNEAPPRADLRMPRRTRVLTALLVLLIQIAVVLGLIRAFAPDFAAQVTNDVVEALTVTITTPPPPPEQPQDDVDAGSSGEAGKKAVAKDASAPKPKVRTTEKTIVAPQAASTGAADTSGAVQSGDGTGAAGSGAGTGSGTGGMGSGGGAKAVKIKGKIDSARDYPRDSRDTRNGDHVIVALTVGTDGKVKACRVHRASRDAEADRITCDLATRRFVFRPATDSAGNPVESVYSWKQEWWIGRRE